MRKCIVDNCERKQVAKELCDTHYRRIRSGNDVNKPIRKVDRDFDPPYPAVIAGHSWINLGSGDFAKVDLEDYNILNKYSWTLNSSYARTANILMHRMVMNSEFEVDHINHDKLDNRKCNLRVATRNQNQMNRTLISNKKSKFKGVSRRKEPRTSWFSYIKCNQKNIYLGDYDNELDAAKVYDKKAIELFGEFALTNKMMELY